MHKDFESFCRRFQELAGRNEDGSESLAKGIPIVQELISSDLWFRDFIKEALIERSWLKQQPPSLWPNELTLYRSLDQSFLRPGLYLGAFFYGYNPRSWILGDHRKLY